MGTHSKMVRGDTGGVARAGPEGLVATGWNPPSGKQGCQEGGRHSDLAGRAWGLDEGVVVEVCGYVF